MKRFLITSLALLGLVAGAALLAPEYAAAAPKDEICQGVGAVSSGGCAADSGKSISGIITMIVNILSWVIGIVAVIMVMVSGFKYITSGGDSSKVSSAKSTIMYALIGLLVVVFAQTIVMFVLDRSINAGKKTTLNTPAPSTGSKYYAIEFNNRFVL